MNRRFVPAVASLLIIAVTLTSFMPVFADLPTKLVAQPTLRVVTIAEDDEARETGVMWMGTESPRTGTLGGGIPDLMAQFKILVSYNGVPTAPTSTYCQFVETDKANPLKDKQFTAENLKSVPKENPNFICKFRWGKPGVGVLDVYYIGDIAGQYIADYILVVGVDLAVGRTTVYGAEIQDICLLGWPIDGDVAYEAGAPDGTITKANGDLHAIYKNPLGDYKSCEDIALIQQEYTNVGIPWT